MVSKFPTTRKLYPSQLCYFQSSDPDMAPDEALPLQASGEDVRLLGSVGLNAVPAAGNGQGGEQTATANKPETNDDDEQSRSLGKGRNKKKEWKDRQKKRTRKYVSLLYAN
jgi:hypothetical protein